MDALQFFWLRRDGLQAARDEVLDASEAELALVGPVPAFLLVPALS